MMSYKFLLSLIIIVSLTKQGSCAPDNQGTEFIIAFMDNYLDYLNLELFVTTQSKTEVNVLVTTPRWTSPSVNEHFTVIAGTVKQIFLPVKLRLTGTTKESKGILVTGDKEIIIYGINKQGASNDGFLGLPTDVLGMEYYAVTYYPPFRKAQICLVGVKDDTSVTIKLHDCSNCGSVTYLGKTYNKGDTLSFTFNKFDAIQFQSSGDLSGAHISSTKPISAFSGNIKTRVTDASQDHLVEQLMPVGVWGKTFVTVSTPTRVSGDLYKFITSKSDTVVSYTCNNSVNIITRSISLSSPGDHYMLEIPSNNFCLFVSTNPVALFIIVKSQKNVNIPSDPALITIPPVEQYASDYTFSTPKYTGGSYENYVMFIVKRTERGGLRLDGDLVPSTTKYVDIPKTELTGGITKVTDGVHTFKHVSPISVFGLFLFGTAHLESYGFPAGIRMAKINEPCFSSFTVPGDGIDNDCDGLIDEELCGNSDQTDDDNDGIVNEDCAIIPIDGGWSSWNDVMECECTRSRTCTNPEPLLGGEPCSGNDTETSIFRNVTSCTDSVSTVVEDLQPIDEEKLTTKEIVAISVSTAGSGIIIAIICCCCIFFLCGGRRSCRGRRRKKRKSEKEKHKEESWLEEDSSHFRYMNHDQFHHTVAVIPGQEKNVKNKKEKSKKKQKMEQAKSKTKEEKKMNKRERCYSNGSFSDDEGKRGRLRKSQYGNADGEIRTTQFGYSNWKIRNGQHGYSNGELRNRQHALSGGDFRNSRNGCSYCGLYTKGSQSHEQLRSIEYIETMGEVYPSNARNRDSKWYNSSQGKDEAYHYHNKHRDTEWYNSRQDKDMIHPYNVKHRDSEWYNSGRDKDDAHPYYVQYPESDGNNSMQRTTNWYNYNGYDCYRSDFSVDDGFIFYSGPKKGYRRSIDTKTEDVNDKDITIRDGVLSMRQHRHGEDGYGEAIMTRDISSKQEREIYSGQQSRTPIVLNHFYMYKSKEPRTTLMDTERIKVVDTHT